MTEIGLDDINQAVAIGHLNGFTGNFQKLGGGEVNDTFVLDCGENKVVLRIARYDTVRILQQEAKALSLLDLNQVPKLMFFDESKPIKNRLWILEGYIKGNGVDRLNINQYRSLGGLLAEVHKVTQPDATEFDFWHDFLDACKHFGDEQALLNHSDEKLRRLIRRGYHYFMAQKPAFGSIHKSLIHGDVTPSNMLVNGNEVSLIDWEFSKYKDPMADFSTLYYEDMEYNKGKWRVHIKEDEKAALFEGYRHASGKVDKQRLVVWFNLDKLGAAVYLYWKMHQSGHDIEHENLTQYRVDLDNLVWSLERNL